MAKFFDQKYKLWKLCDAEETSELVLVCGGVKWWQLDKKGAEEGQIRAVFELEFCQGKGGGRRRRRMSADVALHASVRRVAVKGKPSEFQKVKRRNYNYM